MNAATIYVFFDAAGSGFHHSVNLWHFLPGVEVLNSLSDTRYVGMERYSYDLGYPSQSKDFHTHAISVPQCPSRADVLHFILRCNSSFEKGNKYK
jgi:hypothetical protein